MGEHTLVALQERLKQGIPAGDVLLRAVEVKAGRHAGEVILRVAAARKDRLADIALLLLYAGRPPLYRAWAEVYGLAPEVRWAEGETLPYFDSPIERTLLAAIAEELGPGERIYVDCEADAETRLGMSWGFPEPVTRAGFLLYGLGFTWFKAWYYPEGMWEGGQKLQAEKPVDEAAAQRHRDRWQKEIQRFLKRAASLPEHPFVARAVARAHQWLAMHTSS